MLKLEDLTRYKLACRQTIWSVKVITQSLTNSGQLLLQTEHLEPLEMIDRQQGWDCDC